MHAQVAFLLAAIATLRHSLLASASPLAAASSLDAARLQQSAYVRPANNNAGGSDETDAFVVQRRIKRQIVRTPRTPSVSRTSSTTALATTTTITTTTATTTTTTTTTTTATTTTTTSTASTTPWSTTTRTTIARAPRTSGATVTRAPTPTPTCVPPSTTFAGTQAGFASLCGSSGDLRTCEPAYAPNVQWAGANGPITRAEIESSLSLLTRTPPQLTNNIGNGLANSQLGSTLISAAQLFESTGDRRALDLALQLADNILALRNDPVNGTVLWTGRREVVWPTKEIGKYPLQYAGCENGMIVANMVLPAIHVLKTPCLWSQFPQRFANFSGPTAFSANDNYLARAQRIVQAGDEVYSTYFFPWFFDASRNIIQPNDPRWLQVGDIGASNRPGLRMAWNRGMMILDGMIKLAAAHETAPVANPALTARYDDFIRVNIQAFVADCTEVTAPNGAPAYDWDYQIGMNNTEEVKGIHAYFDVVGVMQAWQRNPPLYGLNDIILERFANTMQYIVYKGPSAFSSYIDGSSTLADPPLPIIFGGWASYGKFAPAWYQALYASVLAPPGTAYWAPWMLVPILNAKQNLVTGAWRGLSASGKGILAV